MSTSQDRCDQWGEVPTIGAIARRLGVPVHRVQYIVRWRGIREVSRAGCLRVYGQDAVDQIARELGVNREVSRG